MTSLSKNPVIVIGLDAAQPSLLEKWMSEGYLPNLTRLREKGTYGHLENFRDSNVETAWTTVATGCSPQTTGYWAAMGLKEGTYETETRAAYDFQEYSPFFAHLKDYRIATFDVPQLRIREDINGLQIGGWGAHSPQVPSSSVPESLWQEIISKHGNHHPKLPDADLIVVWREEHMTDVVESPTYGRIGPFPFYRSASHREKGFIIACGENIPKGKELSDGHVLDLPPTILSLMNAEIPEHLEGKTLLKL